MHIYENENQNKEDVNEQTREINFIKTSTPFRVLLAVYVCRGIVGISSREPSAVRAVVCMSIIQSDI